MPDPRRLESDVRRLAVPRHPVADPEALAEAEAHVALEFGAAGLRVERQPFIHAGREARNVLGTLDGSDPERPWVVVGAHFDSVAGSPGADDNASGVAAMLEVARLVAGTSPVATVQFVGFTLEEVQQGLVSRVGSREYARHFAASGRRLAGALVLEMLGFTGPFQHVPAPVRLVKRVPRDGRFLAVVGDRRSRRLVAEFEAAAAELIPLVTLAVPFRGWPVPHSRMSDNARFWDEGLPAVMVTDTAFLRNPHYHRASDTPETLDWDFLAGATAAVAVTVRRLAGSWGEGGR